MGANESIRISVVIPTHSQWPQLERLLDSLDNQVDAPRFEVIVVDDASKDETPMRARAWAARDHRFAARYLRNERNAGPAAARNRATLEAEGMIIAFTDSDCVASPQWLERLTKNLEPNAGIAGAGGTVQALNPNGLVARFFTSFRVLDPDPRLLYLVTANCCYLRSALLEVGGFDEDLPKPGGEDVGLCMKLSRLGWRFILAPDALVYHDYRESWLDFIRTWRRYGYGSGYESRKHLPVDFPSDAPETFQGWYPNPLRVNEFRFWHARYAMRQGWRQAIEHYGCRRTALGFALLRVLQFFMHRRGWQSAEADCMSMRDDTSSRDAR